MDRRIFLAKVGGCLVTTPLVVRAQQPTIPTIGLLRGTRSAPFANIVDALRRGLKETGFVEGQNLIIEQRWADNQVDRIPALAADLVRLHVSVIVTDSGRVAKQATATIPIVFVASGDPVATGLVASLNRPGGSSRRPDQLRAKSA
jgi:putative ABC transport system substrate-binding protein